MDPEKAQAINPSPCEKGQSDGSSAADGGILAVALPRLMKTFDRSKSLQQLTCQDWGEATDDSRLVTECHRLRRVPLRDFKAEDLRLMAGQNIGLEYLVPLALEQLEEDPFAEGDYYPGDLLVSVLGARPQFWLAHPDLRERAGAVAHRAISLMPSLSDGGSQTVTTAVTKSYAKFEERNRNTG
jgi:hypothetical protein